MKNLLILVWAAISLLAAAFLFVLANMPRDETFDRTGSWPQYYATTVSHYFKLPREVVIMKAEHTDTAIMGELFSIRFQLPSTKTPDQWLQQMSRDSSLPVDYRKSRFVYDCDGDCDLLRLEYLPEEMLYQAQGGWD